MSTRRTEWPRSRNPGPSPRTCRFTAPAERWLALDDWEAAVVAFGRRLAVTPYTVPDEVYAPIAARLTREQIVALTAFGALMVATNVFNNALDVPLDDYLEPFLRGEARHG